MRVTLELRDVRAAQADALVVNLFQGVTHPGGATGAVDEETGGAVRRAIDQGAIRGKLREVVVLRPERGWPRVVVVGLGPPGELDGARIRLVAQLGARAAEADGARSIALIAHGAGIGGVDPAVAAEATVLGTLRALYHFDRYRTEPPGNRVESVVLLEHDRSRQSVMEAAVARASAVAEAAGWVRDLVNAPSSEKYPERFVELVAPPLRAAGLEVEVLDARALEALGARGVLAVGGGSCHPPAMLVARHGGREPQTAPLALVGKGVTFDSGGISIKPATGMGEMKTDMAGGAAVAGAMLLLGRLSGAYPTWGIIPLAENLPDGSAYRPGDVVRLLSGKTAEIVSTDAEGRLLLADAVAWARRQGAGAVVTIATLTGAAEVALGKVRAGLMGSDAKLVARVRRAGERSAEPVWEMPTDEAYAELNRSDVADLKNSAGRHAGMITAGLFVGAHRGGLPWAHLDVAGTVFRDGAADGCDAGATGFGAELLYRLAAGE